MAAPSRRRATLADLARATGLLEQQAGAELMLLVRLGAATSTSIGASLRTWSRNCRTELRRGCRRAVANMLAQAVVLAHPVEPWRSVDLAKALGWPAPRMNGWLQGLLRGGRVLG